MQAMNQAGGQMKKSQTEFDIEPFTDYYISTDGTNYIVVDNHTGIDLGEFNDYNEAEKFAENWLVEKGY